MGRKRRNPGRRKRRLVLTAAILITIAALALLILPEAIEKYRWNRDREDIMELYKGDICISRQNG